MQTQREYQQRKRVRHRSFRRQMMLVNSPRQQQSAKCRIEEVSDFKRAFVPGLQISPSKILPILSKNFGCQWTLGKGRPFARM